MHIDYENPMIPYIFNFKIDNILLYNYLNHYKDLDFRYFNNFKLFHKFIYFISKISPFINQNFFIIQ